jgi:hypothetical protein
MLTDMLKDRVMTNACFKKTEMPQCEEGQIYYIRNELYSTMACFKHEHCIAENNRSEMYLSPSFSQKKTRIKF